jgi:hypothetical protein
MDVFEHVIRGVCLLHAWQSLHEARTLDESIEACSGTDDDSLAVGNGSRLVEHVLKRRAPR